MKLNYRLEVVVEEIICKIIMLSVVILVVNLVEVADGLILFSFVNKS